MMAADVFVGIVAMVIGVASLAAAVTNREYFYQFPKIRWIEKKGGRAAARAFYTLLGVLLILLGAAIACGFRFNLMRPSTPLESGVRSLESRSDGMKVAVGFNPRLS
jgi:hypothetical protein